MKVTAVHVYSHLLPAVDAYNMSSSTVGVPDSTIVEVRTDTEHVGWGEVCPTGPLPQPEHAGSIRADLALAAPSMVGVDPRKLSDIWAAMDGVMLGGTAAKSTLDIACWDIVGKAAGQGVCDLLGGALTDTVATYHVVPIGTPEASAALAVDLQDRGHTRLQLKVGGRELDDDIAAAHAVAAVVRPGVDLFADTNRGWTVEETIRFSNACRDLDLAIEQPCATYFECEDAKPSLHHPLLLDESAADYATIERAIRTGLANGFGTKLTRVGGITAMRAIRDLCIETGTPTSFDDSWGGDIITAAGVHVAATMPEELTRGAWTSHPYHQQHYDEANGPRIVNGRIPIPAGPGLGIEIPNGLFGEPIATYA